MPSSKWFSLPEDITPEHISELTGATARPSKDGKCVFQWDFFAAKYIERKSDGELVQIAFPCAIWDYKGSRWSAYGPREVFVAMGLLPDTGN